MPFRLSALQAGLELEPGTSPPVLRRVKGLTPNRFEHLADEADPQFDVVRGALRFFGPATVKETTAFLDAAAKDVKAHWPDDVVEVEVAGPARPSVRAGRRARRAAGCRRPADGGRRGRAPGGALDGFLQGRDREVLVPGAAHRKASGR